MVVRFSLHLILFLFPFVSSFSNSVVATSPIGWLQYPLCYGASLLLSFVFRYFLYMCDKIEPDVYSLCMCSNDEGKTMLLYLYTTETCNENLVESAKIKSNLWILNLS